MFKAKLEILPPPQAALWPELSTTPENMALYGGTAIALRLGHRQSVDFDFFSFDPVAPSELANSLPYLQGGTVRQSAPNTLTMTLERNGPVQVSFFGNLRIGQVMPFDMVEGPGFRVASLLDLAGMKAAVVTQRAELKVYLDIHALLTQAKIPIAEMLAAAEILYADEISPLIALKAIAYHDDPALDLLPRAMRRDIAAAVKAVDVEKLPAFSPFRARRPRP